MFKLPDSWEEWKTVSEIFKNIIEALAVIGGVAWLLKWLDERKDRATGILLQLEREVERKTSCKVDNASKIADGMT
jgi:hypothetical protein